MKKAVLVLICVLLTFCFLSAKKYALGDDVCQQLANKYTKGKFLVVKQDGIPTVLLSTRKDRASDDALGMLLAKKKTYIPIKVRLDGTWKEKGKTFGWSESNAVLEHKEILKQVDILQVNKESIEIKTETTTGHQARLKGGICGTNFIFEVAEDETFDAVDERISEYLDVYNSIEEIGKTPAKELSLGMTTEEVIRMLGEPTTKVNLRGKVMFKYSDGMVITFQEGKVTDIRL